MKILVTGGAGYIGSILCPILLNDGHEVVLYDNFLWGVKPILHFAQHPSLHVVAGDIRDESKLKPALSGADAVIHLAAIVGYPACSADESAAESINVGGTRLLCKHASPAQTLIFACTGSTYGQVEGTATEETPINPLTLYGRTKREGESMVLDAGGISLRFATVFGLSPRLRLDLLVNDFCYQAVHHHLIVIFEGGHRRTFLHAKDAAAVYPFALANMDRMKGEIFNVGSRDLNYTKIDVAHRIQKFQDFYLHEANVGEDLDKRDYDVCYRKIETLGYHADVSMNDGIQELLKVVPLITIRSEWKNA